MPPGRGPDLYHVEVYVGLEQPYGGVHGVNVEDELPELGLHAVQLGGDLLALADQAGENRAAEASSGIDKVMVHVSRRCLRIGRRMRVDRTILELYSRLAAIEYMLMHLQKLAYLNARVTPDAAEKVITASLESIRTQVYPGFADPVESDQFAAAVEERLSNLLHGAKAMLETELRGHPETTASCGM